MNIPIKEYLSLLRQYLMPQKMRVFWLGVLLFGGIGLQLLAPQVIRRFIDIAQAGGSLSALLTAGALFIGSVLGQRIFAIATTYVGETIAWTATNELRADVTKHVLRLDMGFHNTHTPGELLERIDGDIDRLANFFSEFGLRILAGGLLAIGVMILLFQEDWRLGVLIGIFTVAYLVVHTKGQQMAGPQWSLERERVADLMGFVEERMAGVKDIQTSGAIDHTMRRFYDVHRRRIWQAFKADVYTDVAWTISKTLYEAGTVAAMALGAFLFLRGSITIGTVYLIIHYLGMMNEPLNRIGRQLEDLQRIRVSIERTKTLVDTQPKIADGLGAKLPSHTFAIKFDNVSFAYNAETTVLEQVSFTLPAGQVLGLLGRTGSGKTTLSRLMFRLYDLDQGQIYLDDVPIDQPNLADLRDRVGMVTQDVQLFEASVRDNLAFFDPTITDVEILAGLHTLGLEAWYQSLPNGLDTMLAADGKGLSAGEGQLLALTRIFLKDPSLVILDEASSRLDPATEQLLETAMDRLLENRTAIIIAHRLTTVQRANQIMILDAGRVQEHGRYDDLIAQSDSVFARLLKTGLTEVLA